MKQIVDPLKKFQTKRDVELNKLIKDVLKENTGKMKLDRDAKNSEKIKTMELNETNKLNKTDNINIYENKLPYLLIGLVESTFVDENNMRKVRENGIGIVIQNNIILVAAKNLIFDNRNFNEKNPENMSNFQLFEVEFSLLNLSKYFNKYLPLKLKVKDFFTPLDLENENLSEEEKIRNSWGIVLLEYPIGEFLKFILEEIETDYTNKNMSSKMKYNDNFFCKNPEKLDFININYLNNKEIESSEIYFLEGKEIEINSEDETNFYFFEENFYEMKFDENLIYLNSEDSNNREVLPGIILAKCDRRFYILGMNTNMMIKTNHEEIQQITNDDEHIQRIAIRFDKNTISTLNNKIQEIKSNSYLSQQSHIFSNKLFRIFDNLIVSKDEMKKYLRDNSILLIKIINELRNNKKLKLSIEENEMLDLFSGKLNEELKIDKIFFIKFAFTLIWNKLSNMDLQSDTINFESIKMGIIPGSDIIAAILKSMNSLVCLNLKNNNLFEIGIRNLIRPIFNTKQIFFLGKDLQYIHLDNNKLCSKSMKYLRHLLKVCPKLMVLTLSHNYICNKGLSRLRNSLKGKENLKILDFSFNILGHKSSKYLGEILKEFVNLRTLDIQSNNLTDQATIIVLNNLSTSITDLHLGYNGLTEKIGELIGNYLNSTNNLSNLSLNNNNLSDQGVKFISNSLGPNKKTNFISSLTEINLNNISLTFKGVESLFNSIKNNENIKKIFLNSNCIEDEGCQIVAEYFKYQNENCINYGLTYLSLADNLITDIGAKHLVDPLMNHRTIQEIKLNSNLITDEGGELLLYAVLYNNSIIKFNIENNKTTWRENNLNIKNIRNNIQIFF